MSKFLEGIITGVTLMTVGASIVYLTETANRGHLPNQQELQRPAVVRMLSEKYDHVQALVAGSHTPPSSDFGLDIAGMVQVPGTIYLLSGLALIPTVGVLSAYRAMRREPARPSCITPGTTSCSF